MFILKTVICRSRNGLSASEKEGKNTSNDNYYDSLKLLNVNTLKLPGALIVTQELLKTPCSSPIYKYLSKSIIHLNLLNYVKI